MTIMKKIRNIVTAMLLLIAIHPATAQIYPIQATTQLVPPYAVYLPDYATGINNQLRVLLLNKDVTQPDYKVKLIMSIELNGSLIMRTSDTYAPGPITLQPNQPFSVEGLELAPYMNSANIDFIGYSRQDYEQKKGLPEGAYKICFTAYDYYRPDRVKVSNDGCSFYYLTKNDPPFVNMPACGLFIAPQQNDQENLIDKAGRWLSYTLDMPWDNAEKNLWYDEVEQAVTQTFSEKVNNAIAKNTLYEIGMHYAALRSKQWDAAYGRAWASLVLKELTDDEFIYWSRTKLKTGAVRYIVPDNTGDTGGGLSDGGIESDVDLQPYLQVAPAGNATINFMWTPRHTSSPNSTLTTRYKIELYEVRPKVPNEQLPAMANNAVLTSPPIFTDETDVTTYTYGADKPALIDGLQYAWRIKAFDAGGRDWFKNNGYSEVCYFTFGGVYNPVNNPPGLEEINTFNAQAETERRGLGQWTQTGGYTSYRVRYRKKNGSGNWFEVNTDSLNAKLYDLEPTTTYQAQVQGKAGQFYGPFSPVKEFITPTPTPPPGCGLPLNYAAGLSTKPLTQAAPNMFIKCGKFEIQLDSVIVESGAGYYSGAGRITSMPFLNILQIIGAMAGNANSGNGDGLKVTFNSIFINDNREVTQGIVYAVSRPLEEWIGDYEAYYADVKLEKQQAKNRRLFADLDSNAVMLQIDKAITNVSFDKNTNTITFTDANGNITTQVLQPGQIGHDIIIQGKGNDQWVIKADGTTHFVEGGGLYPGMNRPVSSGDIDMIKLALQKMKAEYTAAKIQQVETAYNTAAQAKISYLNDVYNPAGAGAGTANKGVIFIGSTQIADVNVPVTPFSQLDITYNQKQKELNKVRLVKIFTNEVNTSKEYELLCQILTVQSKNVMEFIKQKKQAGIANDIIAADIKNGLLILFEDILTD
jgi:Fibronectin type III domain